MSSLIFDELEQHRLIPVVEIDDVESAVPLAESLLAGGFTVIEVTLRTPAAVEAIAQIRTRLPEMMVGAGTILGRDQVPMVHDAGAQFGVSPVLNASVVKTAEQHTLPFIPGILTPTEFDRALNLKCKLIKFFPAGPAGGTRYLQALEGPYQNCGARIYATGGVSLDVMNDYLSLPMVWAVGGSWIASRKQIVEREWQQITNQAQESLQRLAEGNCHG